MYKKTRGQEGQLEEGVKGEEATRLVCTGVTGPDTFLWAEAHQREGTRHSSKKTDGQIYIYQTDQGAEKQSCD